VTVRSRSRSPLPARTGSSGASTASPSSRRSKFALLQEPPVSIECLELTSGEVVHGGGASWFRGAPAHLGHGDRSQYGLPRGRPSGQRLGNWIHLDDASEDDDTAATATVLTPAGSTTPGELYLSASRTDLFLCPSDEDWLAVQTDFGDSPVLFSIRLQAAGAGYCGAGCEEYVPPAGPENTVLVEVYDASTMALVASATNDQGRIWIDAFGPEFAHNVLVRVHGPPQATYRYQLFLMVRSGYYEDECECLRAPTPDR
jgi:hypothetical protein